MGWRDGDKHHTKGGASRCGTVDLEGGTEEICKRAYDRWARSDKDTENTEKDGAVFRSPRLSLRDLRGQRLLIAARFRLKTLR